jgi:hypothetical protein
MSLCRAFLTARRIVSCEGYGAQQELPLGKNGDEDDDGDEEGDE